MALATSSLVDGEWVTRTLDVNTVLRHYDQQDRDAATTLTEVEKAPRLGLLTQTVIRSPLVHWILPIRLRDDKHHDVAFIGDDFVQIKELRSDGLLWDVVRKEDFGARIRNARVVGSVKAYERDPEIIALSREVKAEDADEDAQMNYDETPRKVPPSAKSALPPQSLLLQLDTGDSVFLMKRQSENDKLEFVYSKYRVAKPMLKLQPGMHLAVDPSSRYMAVGCSEGVFAIYSLHSRDSLKQQCLEGSALRHVECETQLYPNGVILKMEFLYPAADDDEHIILLVLVIMKGKTRMLLYEWETGSDLKKIAARSPRGYLMERARQMPLLLIPLTIKSSFILVYEDAMTVCQGILHGTPKFVDFYNSIDKPTAFHHGSGNPLWTSWTRPSRLESHKATRDDLFIAREDGLIKFLEIDSEDADVVTADNNIGEFEANCGTALASLDYPNKNQKSGDLFIMGGDSCSGGTYLLQARKLPVLTEPIPNWSPAHDFVTTYQSKNHDFPTSGPEPRQDKELIPKPDRIFVCVGKGSTGGITELRHGHEANIGLEVDYDTIIMNAWVLSPDSNLVDESDPYIFLLSMGDRSGVLQLSADATDIVELEENATSLDLKHRTIVAVTHGQFVIQVTEKSIVITDGTIDRIYKMNDLLRVHQGESFVGCGTMIDNATIAESSVLFTTRIEAVDGSKFLQILDFLLPASNMDIDSVDTRTLCRLSHDVTSIAAGRIAGDLYAIVAGLSKEGSMVLTFQTTSGGPHNDVVIPPIYGNRSSRLDAIVSIVVLTSVPGTILLLCGTRNGNIVALEIDEITFSIVASHSKRIGATPALVSRDEFSESGISYFVKCDSKAYVLTPRTRQSYRPGPGHYLQALEINQIWLSDALKPGLQQPKITSIARMRPLSGGTSGSLLVISGSQLLITGLSAQAKPVTRHIAIGGTPTRILYSHVLDLLVVAALVKGKSSLVFIDPETGEDISQPLDEKTKAVVEFVSGLGNTNERIFRLFEWSFTKDSKTWHFVIASTSTGRLLIISIYEQDQNREAIHSASSQSNGTRAKRRICYYTRHKFKYSEPIYSATGLSDGLLWGAGKKLFYDVLDLALKKFRRVAEYDLPSPATNLFYEDGSIYALTSCHSLEMLRLVPNEAGELRIERTHGDQLARDVLHHLVMDRPSQRPIHLVSDKLSAVVGLWPTYNTKADTLEAVFEAALPSSILRFRYAKCRPVWDPVWTQLSSATRNGAQHRSIVNIMNTQEVLGLSISGSLSHFAILDFKTWRLLRFITDLAIRSPKICEFTYKDDPMPLDTMTEPKIMMHIDGDILKRCLEDRRLWDLLRVEENTEDARQIFGRFTELLRDVHRGSLGKDDAPDVYVNQVFADLQFYLRPVL